MSIRLRLTLLYSVILALTLIVFSTVLYLTQSETTLGAIRTTLARQAAPFASGLRRFPSGAELPPPIPNLPGRWTQLRGADGTVTSRTPDLASTTLPLSDAGMRAAQSGSPWSEVAQVEDQPVLIYSEPIVNQGRFLGIVQVAAPISEREQSLNNLRLLLIAGSGLVIIAAFGIGWILAGAALNPIHRITSTAQTIGSERDFSRRVQHTGPNDEIGQLAVTFNEMLSKLESAYRQVEQALQAQRRFVADASHELRTPLTTIRGNIELLRREPPLDRQERSDILSDARDEVNRLIRLVQQLLILARADAGHPVRCEALPIQPIVDDVYRQAKLLAPQRTIHADAPVQATILANRDALKQVLLILLENAIVHTPANAQISMTSALTDHRVAISIRDDGPGISPNSLPHLFERFYRGDVSRSAGGTGLGLAIAKDLVHAQNGTLTVESHIGRGSTFTVMLPRVNKEGGLPNQP